MALLGIAEREHAKLDPEPACFRGAMLAELGDEMATAAEASEEPNPRGLNHLEVGETGLRAKG